MLLSPYLHPKVMSFSCKVLLPISSLVVHKYIARLWGMLRECTLGSSRVLCFLLMLYKLMPFYYQSLSWLHLHCNGSCLLYKLCRVGILKIYSGTVSFMDDLYWSSLANSLMDYDWCKLLECNHFRCGITVL